MPNPPSGPLRPHAQAQTMWVRRTFPHGDEFEQQNLEVSVFLTTPAQASASASRTINTGNYESIKITVGVTIPCYQEELQEGLDVAFMIVGAKLGQEHATIVDALNAKSAAQPEATRGEG